MQLQEINRVIQYGGVSKRGAGERGLALLRGSGPEVAMAAPDHPSGSHRGIARGLQGLRGMRGRCPAEGLRVSTFSVQADPALGVCRT